MEDSIFAKIIKGEVPCHKVYEDDKTIAILDINPLNPGHTLVIPKQQIDHLWDCDDELYQYLWSITKRVAQQIQRQINPPRVGTSVEGFAVPHTHIHVFPLYKGFEQTISEHFTKPKSEPDHPALTAMAEKLRFTL